MGSQIVASPSMRFWKKMAAYGREVRRFPVMIWRNLYKVGREDPRRALHALKVGTSLTLVTLLYLIQPLSEGIGQNAIWAVMTVVVVLEFTAGATLCKGLNRGLGTLLAGTMAFFIKFVADESGHFYHAFFVGTAVFFMGTAATYIRFIPYIKKNYDYGVVIFLLTFNLITQSSYRAQDVVHVARDRLNMIAIGCGMCLLMSLLVFPIWSGQDLHNVTVSKLEGLARSITACVDEYFDGSKLDMEDIEKPTEDPIIKAVLDSKSSDDLLALYASWEPRRSRYKFPWRQYVKLGGVLRHFGYTVVALHGCLQTEIQTPKSVRAMFKDPCVRVAVEVSKVLTELANSIRNRRHCSPEILSDHLHEALHDLDIALKSQPRLFLGSNANANHHHHLLALAAAAATGNKSIGKNNPTGVPSTLTSVKTDSSALLEWKSKLQQRKAAQPATMASAASLRPTLSKIAATSLEFAEALPFAAFASLLVETVARLDLVIEEVEELSRVAHFKDYDPHEDEGRVQVTCEVAGDDNKSKKLESSLNNHLPCHGAAE
ncbi:hypothetical protein V2J09_020365 [Rumex salicifolius]